jgi:hypothetical protein
LVVIGFGIVLGAYAIGIWGYCLVRGYDVPFAGIWGATWPGGGQSAPAAAAAATDPGTGTYAV